MKRVFLIGASSVIANSIVKKLIEDGRTKEVIKISRNPKYENDKNYIYIKNYSFLGEVFSTFHSTNDDLIILAFGYLGITGFRENFPSSLEENNQKKVFDINFTQMRLALNYSTEFLKNKGGRILYLSSAAAYPVRPSNMPYGLSKKYIDSFINLQREYLREFKISILSVRIGFVDTPINKNRKKTPFSSTPDKVAKSITTALNKNKEIIYIPKILYFLTKFLIIFPKISNYFDKKFS